MVTLLLYCVLFLIFNTEILAVSPNQIRVRYDHDYGGGGGDDDDDNDDDDRIRKI